MLVTQGATSFENVSVDWARDQFEAAGLVCPAVTVRFHTQPGPCGGLAGTFDGAGAIDVCNRGQLQIHPEHTLLHELAHGWLAENLSEEVEKTFLHERGLSTWDSDDAAWWQRGVEQAAEIVAWGVTDHRLASVWTAPERCVDLDVAYRLLTGLPPVAYHDCRIADDGKRWTTLPGD